MHTWWPGDQKGGQIPICHPSHDGSTAHDIACSFLPTVEDYGKATAGLRSRSEREELLIEFYICKLLSLVVQNVLKAKTTPYSCTTDWHHNYGPCSPWEWQVTNTQHSFSLLLYYLSQNIWSEHGWELLWDQPTRLNTYILQTWSAAAFLEEWSRRQRKDLLDSK